MSRHLLHRLKLRLDLVEMRTHSRSIRKARIPSMHICVIERNIEIQFGQISSPSKITESQHGQTFNTSWKHFENELISRSRDGDFESGSMT